MHVSRQSKERLHMAVMTTLATREATWDSIGYSTGNTSAFEEALAKSHLDFEAKVVPAMCQVGCEMLEIPKTNAVVGTDNKIHGVVSDAYHIIQNRDAFSFAQYIGDDLTFLRGGETGSGLNYLIGALPSIKILGDEFTPHLILQNAFNKKYACKAAIYPLRIVCQNQFNIAFSEADNVVAIRHSSTAAEKLEQAKETIAAAAGYMSEFSKLAEKFATLHVGKDAAAVFADYLFPITDDMADTIRQRIQMKRDDFINCYAAADNANFRGSAWGLINAYTDFATHYAGTNEKKNVRTFEKRFERSLYTPMNNIIEYVEGLAA